MVSAKSHRVNTVSDSLIHPDIFFLANLTKIDFAYKPIQSAYCSSLVAAFMPPRLSNLDEMGILSRTISSAGEAIRDQAIRLTKDRLASARFQLLPRRRQRP
jgi:hypothetical protein